MRSRPFFDGAVIALSCLASMVLDCRHQEPTKAERRGEELYARTCAVCHGRAGQGYAADQAPALANPEFLASVTDAYLRHAIAQGRRGTTMSAWSAARGGPLTVADVDAVIAFIRSWGHSPRAVLDERTTAGDPARGASVYAAQCEKCHGARGAGGPNIHIGNPELLATASNGFLRYAIQRGRSGTAMPAFEHVLDATGVDDALSLLRSWQEAAAPAAAASTPPPPTPPLPLGPVPLNPDGPAPIGFHALPEMTSADAVKGQLDRGARMAILDARAPSDYVYEHIAGAVSVPFYDPEPYIAALPKDAWLVCYCACPHAESGQLAQKLLSKGFTKVTVLNEGLGYWRGKAYPTHTGASP